ncbi:MAG: DUF72 domain-containing protein [Candidatus Heimdallarchaeaceae archaeon]
MPDLQLYIGCTGFNYISWSANKGGFYPPRINKEKLLEFYVTQFPTCEINSTYYSIPSEQTTKRWAQSLPEGFKLTAKMPKDITQAVFLSATENILEKFLQSMRHLKPFLGPLVLQFSPSFKKNATNVQELTKFIAKFPLDEYELAIEFRDESWFESSTFDFLNENNLGLVSAFLPYLKFRIFEEVKNRYYYLRLIGSWDVDIEEGRVLIERNNFLKDVVSLIEFHSSKNTEKDIAYIYVNNHLSGYAPRTAKQLIEEFKNKGMNPLQPFKKRFDGQQSLTQFFK